MAPRSKNHTMGMLCVWNKQVIKTVVTGLDDLKLTQIIVHKQIYNNEVAINNMPPFSFPKDLLNAIDVNIRSITIPCGRCMQDARQYNSLK